MDVPIPEIDPNFEPQARARSNTWPCRPQEVIVEAQCSPASDESTSENALKQDNLGLNKKTSSRRNAWGNLSYADLITKAIQGSTEQRLTLSQIYDWMVQNVPYFKDKGDNTSSAGWKNSIRHNLSLHSRFMRIQNEGTGKSSWWVINPDAKPGKTPRRRAGSMETKSYEKRRGRVKKKVDALRQALENNNSPTSEDYLTDSPLAFQLSPEFRQRTSSNASSCGRLSPIQAGIEPDLHDNQVPPMSPIPWCPEENSVSNYDQMGQYDQLVDTLVDSMKLGDKNLLSSEGGNGLIMPLDQNDIEMLADGGLPPQLLANDNVNNMNMSQFRDQSANYDDAQYRNMPAPPAYPGDTIRRSPQQQAVDQLSMQNGNFADMNNVAQQGNMGMFNQQADNMFGDMLLQQSSMSPVSSQLSVNTQQQQQQSLSSPARSPQSQNQISPNYGGPNFPIQGQLSPQTKQLSPQLMHRQQQQVQQNPNNRSILQQVLEAPAESLLRAALTQKPPSYPVPRTSQQPIQQPQVYNTGQFANSMSALRSQQTQGGTGSNGLNNNSMRQQQQQRALSQSLGGNMPSMQPQTSLGGQLSSSSGLNISQQQQQQQQQQPVMGIHGHNPSTNSLNEIDPDFFDLSCDVDQVLQHELSLEGNLDFNFDPVSSTATSGTDSHMVR